MTVGGGQGPARLPDTSVGPAPVAGSTATLASGLVRVTAPNPGLMTGPGTNTYVLGRGDVAVVDPGPEDPGHLDAIEAAVAERGDRIRWVLVTHTHVDHAPGAGPLAARAGATLVGHGARDGFVPGISAADGWVLEAPTFRLVALHTPGHAANHICWLWEQRRIVFSGDHVMGGTTVVIPPPDGDMAAYLASVRRLEDLQPPLELIAPGHGPLLGEPRRVLGAIVEHRLQREALVAAALEDAGTATVDELVERVYADVDPALAPIARASLWAHLRKLADDGRAVSLSAPDDAGPPRYRSATASAGPG